MAADQNSFNWSSVLGPIATAFATAVAVVGSVFVRLRGCEADIRVLQAQRDDDRAVLNEIRQDVKTILTRGLK